MALLQRPDDAATMATPRRQGPGARLRAIQAQLRDAPCSELSSPSALADALLEQWQRPSATPLTHLPTLADLEEALSVNRAMAVSPLAASLGGHCGWKMGWKGSFEERPILCGPMFGMGLFDSGTSVSLSAHRIFSAEAEFCITLGSALTPRSEPYTEAEVWAAVGTVQLCIELCGARQFRSDDRLHSVADALMGTYAVHLLLILLAGHSVSTTS
jgi:2-keto-4-pentenoate hydratase